MPFCLQVPKLSHLIDCTPVELQDDFRNTDSVKNHGFLEAMILNYFDWNVFLPTSSSFAAVILPQVLKDTDLYHDQAITFEQMEQLNMRSQFSELLRYFLRLSIVVSNFVFTYIFLFLPKVLPFFYFYTSEQEDIWCFGGWYISLQACFLPKK